MPRRIATALPSWIIAIAGTAFALTTDAQRWPTVISVTMGATLVISFVVQLSLQRKEGLVNRLALTTAVSLAIGGVGLAAAWLLYGIG
jgi:predicted membrane channel-forming protein YqfA (hemolysin III family)